jgi:hypothetical protein
MKNVMIGLLVLMGFGVVWAQNTPREPIQGGTTNSVTQSEADAEANQKSLSDVIRKKKRKPETTITAEPVQPSTTPSETSAKPATPAPAK